MLIKVESGEVQSAGGLFLPPSAKGRPNTGHVVSVGPGEVSPAGHFVPNPLREHHGARVLFDPYMLVMVFGADGVRNESSVAARGGEYAVIDCDHIQAVLDPNTRVQAGNA